MAKSNSNRITPPARGLTKEYLKNIKCPAGRNYDDVPDRACPGLYVRVSKSGLITFRWNYPDKDTGKNRVLTLGRYGRDGITLKQARELLEERKRLHKYGEQVSEPDAPETVRELADEFYQTEILPNRKRPEVAKYLIDHDILPALGSKPINAVTPLTISRAVKATVARGAPSHAAKMLSLIKQLFNFAVANGYISQSPAYPLRGRSLGCQDNVRDRYLSEDEIREFWHALDLSPRISVQKRAGLRILLLTGVRSSELLLATWDEIDFDNHVWNIPEEHSKTKGWTVPLVPTVEALFLELWDYAGGSHFVMASDSNTGRIDNKTLARCVRRLFEPRKNDKLLCTCPRFTPHDFRRTLRTLIQERDLKAVDEKGNRYSVEPHVLEKLLNHSLGRIEGTYNQSTLLNKRREALQAWAEYVDVIVTERENVAVLHG